MFAVLERLDTDILVLPETWVPHAGEGVVDRLRAAGYAVEVAPWATMDRSGSKPEIASPGEGSWSLAVASRCRILARRDLPLPRTLFDPAGPRVAIQCTLDVSGTTVEMVGLHTSSRLWWGAPFIQLNALRRRLPRFDGPAFLAGDFNLWGPWVERLLPGWERTVRGRTYPSHRPHSQIDHVLVNRRLTFVSGEVVDDHRHSDHRPIRVRLRA
ncbi:MAG: metal-dependent hydrolase [Actinomycetia bacterium]|nr:metal-dependent hydrolase [Actinomycetes bacterium]